MISSCPKRRAKSRRALRREGTLPRLPENMRERNAEVQSQCAMEAAFAAYFGELVSEWNPLLDEGGRMRFLWHEDVGAYDVCVQSVGGGEAGLAGGGSEGGAGEEIGAAAHLQAPERTSLREILDDLLSEPEGGCVDLTPLRRLVALSPFTVEMLTGLRQGECFAG